MIVYRIQPENAELHAVKTVTSNDVEQNGIHVFTSLANLCGCGEWRDEPGFELAEVECEQSDLRNNGDYEGELLMAGRGVIVLRRRFRSVGRIARWAELKSR